jgi:hypothetical protein
MTLLRATVLARAVGHADLLGIISEGKLATPLPGLRQRHALAALNGCKRDAPSRGCCAAA